MTIATHAQDVLGTAMSTNFLPPNIKEFDPSKPEQWIKINCSNTNEATTLLSKLTLTTDPTNRTVVTTLVKPVVDDEDPKILIFKIKKAQLSGRQLVPIEIWLENTRKAQFKIREKTLNASTGEDSSPAAIKPTSTDVLALTSISYTRNPLIAANPYSIFSDSITTVHTIVYDLEKNTLRSNPNDTKIAVGNSLTLDLYPVPNPAKFNVVINGDYINFNDSSTSALDNFLLNPFSGSPNISAVSGGSNGERRAKILGFLQEINTSVIQFLQYYRDDAQFIDRIAFQEDKKKLQAAINNVLSKDELKYPGNMQDYIINEFNHDDSTSLASFLKNYGEFQKFNVPQTYLPIAKVGNYDELGITIKVTPKEGMLTGLNFDSTTNRIPFTVYNGIKVDVSTGFFYSFIDQPSYSIRKDSTVVPSSTGADSIKSRSGSIIKESGVNGRMGFASMIHIYSRWGKDVNVSLSLGIGLTLIDDPQLRYMGGISLLLGRTNRIAITAGYMGGKVKELSDRYLNEDKSYRVVSSSENQLSTKTIMKGNFFFGVGYNFPLLKRKK